MDMRYEDMTRDMKDNADLDTINELMFSDLPITYPQNGITKVLIDEELNYKRIKTSAALPKRHEPKYAIDLTYHVNYWRNVMKKEKDRFNVKEFLLMKPKCLIELVHSLKLLIGDDFNNITVNDVAPNLLDILKKKKPKQNLQDLLRQVQEEIPLEYIFRNQTPPSSTVRSSEKKKRRTSTVTSQVDIFNAARPPTSTVTSKTVLIDEELNYKRIKTSAALPKRHEPKYAIDLTYHVNYWRNVMKKEKDRFNVKEFLLMKPKCLIELVHSLKLLIGDDFNNITVNDVAPNLLDILKKKKPKQNLQDLLRQVQEEIPLEYIFRNQTPPSSTVRSSEKKKRRTSTVTSQIDIFNAARPPTSTVTFKTDGITEVLIDEELYYKRIKISAALPKRQEPK
ncbi:hypothetical protein KQX54_004132 [Cotesia glomerata]|uniref:Uncharacterized protein n=1 Tax=Cotesia glomerata TaxID=32391 RepID=A0AAV7HCM5_COTGL|nr:hypothetical protein KQX54_004132 [Cotesia glomerata]